MALAQGLLALVETVQTRPQLLNGLIDTADLLALASSSARAPDQTTRDATSRINGLARDIVAAARRELSGGGASALPKLLADLQAAVPVPIDPRPSTIPPTISGSGRAP